MSYPILPGLEPDGRIFYNPEMGILEAFLPTGGFASAHAPALIELPDGAMLCAWFAGSAEGSPDVRIVVSRLEPGSERWGEPVSLAHDPERSEQNPSFFAAPDGAIWTIYTAQLGRRADKDNMQYTAQIRRQVSRDGGRTWAAPEVLFPREGSFCRQPIQILASGRWIFSQWLCSDAADGLAGDPTVFQISDDEGKTWRQVDMPGSSGRVHAQVVEFAPGRLTAFLRSREADFVYRSESLDDGDSWTEPVPTVLPNNNSSISALILESGRLAIAYNPTSAPSPVRGQAAWPGLRCPVAVALSEDEGKTFPMIRLMERGEGFVGAENRGGNRRYEYPCLIQSRDGMLHLAYAARNRQGVKVLRFTEADVIGTRQKVTHYNPTANRG